MVDLEPGIIIAIALGSLLLVLVLAFLVTSLFVLRRKRLLCFKGGGRSGDAKPFLLSDRELERRHEAWKKQASPFERKGKKKSKPKKRNYQSFSKPPKFPKRDPFATKFLENPMVTSDDLDADWSNPAFDMQGAVIRDAAITIQSWYRMVRERVPYVQLRESTIIAQALFRGRRVRKMLPKFRKEKTARDQLRKKQPGWKKQGTLAGLKYYDVKAFGFAEVEQLYGMETVRGAAEQLKELYGGKGKLRMKLFISVKGIKLYTFSTMEHFATVKVATVSFCTLDPKNRKIFAFINRKRRKNFCHVFQASESDAQKMVETMAQAFEVTFRQVERKKMENEARKVRKAKLDNFERQSQELDDEVQSMLEMAESASQVKLDRMSDFSSEDGGSRSGSRENLLSRSPKLKVHSSRQSVPSSLLTSHKAPESHSDERTRSAEIYEREEETSMTTSTMNYTGLTLDKEYRRARAVHEQKWEIELPSD